VNTALIVAALACSWGCDDGSSDDDDDSVGNVDATFEIDVALSGVIPTVATVTWSVDLDELEAAWIEYGPTGDYSLEAPVELAAEPPHEALLLGMKPASDYQFRVVAQVAEGTAVSDELTVTTGTAPNDLPGISVDIADPDAVAGGFLVTSLLGTPPGAVILDRDGDYVWWYLSDENIQVSRAILSADRDWIYFWSVNSHADTANKIWQVSLDGAVVNEIVVTDGHHDFTELPDGTLAYLDYDFRTEGDQQVDGDRLIERATDGTETEVYNVWDDVEYQGNQGPQGAAWSHANAMDYLVDDDAYLIGFLGFSSIFKIDRASGQTVWRLGGDDSDFTLVGGGQPFANQHQFQWLGDSILVFDNGTPEENSSELVQYRVDEEAMEMELIWSYQADPTVYTVSLGDALRLPNGNTIGDYSMSGQIDEVDPDGELIWRLNMDLGGATGYVDWKQTLY